MSTLNSTGQILMLFIVLSAVFTSSYALCQGCHPVHFIDIWGQNVLYYVHYTFGLHLMPAAALP
jgi:hypothetical protein